MFLGIGAKNLIRYTALPGIRPRLEELFLTGFQHVAYFMALVYGSARLLPENHPYLNPVNMGRFGIRHVIAEAANNLVLDKKNIDQIILFGCVLLGLVLIVIQILLLGTSFMIQPVMAAFPTNFSGFFITPEPSQDIAAMLMDLVFGVPGIYNSCVSTLIPCLDPQGQPVVVELPGGAGSVGAVVDGASIFAPYGFPFPIHMAMHQLFQLYSFGLLVVATFIALYFMVTIVAETAQSGTAFGKRFNKVWAPLRIVAAFGLLVPIGFGLNASQYIVLYAAKYGSGFATNGWTLFNATLTSENILGVEQALVSAPNIPEVGALLQFYYLARTCYHLEANGPNPKDIKMYLVGGPDPTGGASSFLEVGSGTSYDDMMQFAGGSQTVLIRFGLQNPDDFPHHRGNVFPYCGEVPFKLTDARAPGEANPGTEVMQRYYWYILKELWFNVFEGNFSFIDYSENYPLNTQKKYTQWNHDPNAEAPPPPEFKRDLQEFYSDDLRAVMFDPSNAAGNSSMSGVVGSQGAIEAQAQSDRYEMGQLVSKGWAGGAIWYNRIAELNGAVTTAVLNVPLPSLYPDVMEYIQFKKKQQDKNTSFENRFEPRLSDGDDIPFKEARHEQMAGAYWKAFQYWQSDGHVSTPHSAPTGNAIIDAINALFGTEGLYNIRNNPDTHPLAQLVGVGRSLVEASIRNLTVAVVGGASGAGLKFVDSFLGKLASTGATFLVTFAMVGLTAGFILFYIVPFLPFIYFFFAVGGWVKGIFEAMVGAPLWALAHIRIDGNGLPGQAAVNGYFLILEIFLRPILILFGLLASISIFSALVTVLHQIFDLVISNVGGFDVRTEMTGTAPDGTSVASSLEFMRSAIDEFFFTVIYTIIIYLMGMSSFKLIDLIPNNILRWMGQSVATFNDQREDAAQSMVGKATVGAQQASSALGGGLKGIAGAGGTG